MTKLGKYTLHEELGRGGYGTVYRAFDTVLEVERAVKVLHPALVADIEFIERFRREAKLAARLEHSHIVPVYDLGEDQGRFFLAMKYLSGGSLKEVLEQGPLPFDLILQILEQIAAALDFAHNLPEQLIHRDVKPGNILFERDPCLGTKIHARLADLGFAKAVSASNSASLSASGVMIGTPAYMAPEIWREKGASPVTDEYSLACVFTEMLTGEVLFAGDSAAGVMTKHLMDPPQFPATWPKDVPAGITSVLEQSLAKEPKERFTSILQFAEAVKAVRKPLIINISPPTDSEPPKPPAGNDNYQGPTKEPLTTINPDETDSQKEPSFPAWLLWGIGGALAIALIVLLIINLIGGGDIDLTNTPTTQVGIFVGTDTPTTTPSLTIQVLSSNTPTLIPPPPIVTDTPTHTSTSTPKPTATTRAQRTGTIAFVRDYRIYTINVDGTGEKNVTDNGTRNFYPAWSPDGEKLAFSSYLSRVSDEIYIMGDNLEPVNISKHSAYNDRSPVWSPSGEKLLFIGEHKNNGKEIYSVDSNGENFSQLTNARNESTYPSWSPDESKIVFQTDRDDPNYFTNGTDKEIYIMDADGSNQIDLTNNLANDGGPAWSPNGEKIAFTTDRDGNSEIYVMNVDGSNPVNLTKNSASEYSPVWSPDGKYIAYNSYQDGNSEIYIMKPNGEDVVRITNNSAHDGYHAWSPDSKSIVFASDRNGNEDIYVINIDGTDLLRLTHNPEDDRNPTWGH